MKYDAVVKTGPFGPVFVCFMFTPASKDFVPKPWRKA